VVLFNRYEWHFCSGICNPRFDFNFEDYSGQISCRYDENNKPILREEDQIFLKTFGLGVDSDNNRLAVVFLRYLNDLTPEHQSFWKSKEVSGNCKIIEEYYDNAIQGSWTSSRSVFSAFIEEHHCLNELSKHIFGINIFNKVFIDENRPKEFTFFFSPTLKNYNEFILLLDKMISDNINLDFFKDKVDIYEYLKLPDNIVERKQKGTLNLFQEWLSSIYKVKGNDDLHDLFAPFKRVRRERQNPAHKIYENEYDKKYVQLQRETIQDCFESIHTLRMIFAKHPKAKDFEIPEYLENVQIKSF